MKRALLALIIILTIGVVMSLHDVDKTSSNRITSILNSADDVQQRMAQGTSQVQNAGEEESDGLRTLERQIMAVQDGTNKAVFGFYGTANKFGFKVAEDGVDVLTASDDQLLFNSEQNVFKIVKIGTSATPSATVSKAGTNQYGVATNSTTIAHGLGYIPAVIAYAYDNSASTYVLLPWSSQNGVSTNSFTTVTYGIAVDDTNVYLSTNLFTYNASVTESGWNVKYYLLQETAN